VDGSPGSHQADRPPGGIVGLVRRGPRSLCAEPRHDGGDQRACVRAAASVGFRASPRVGI